MPLVPAVIAAKMDLPPEFQAYREKSARLRKFDSGIDHLLREALGKDWLAAGSDAEAEVLSPRQRGWRVLRHFYEASIVNSGDLFGYLHMVYDHRELFEEIGAHKTLRAADDLRPLYEQYSGLPSDQEKGDFWHQTRDQRASLEGEAEGMGEFAGLLISFAEAHPDDFPEGLAQNPFSRISEMLDTLRRKDADGSLRERIDSAEGLFEDIFAKLGKGKDDQERPR